jgi:hypothetical protein
MTEEHINLIWAGKKFTCEEDCTCHTECKIADKYIEDLKQVKNCSQSSVSGSVCNECTDGSGWWGDEDITYNCSKCNPEAN